MSDELSRAGYDVYDCLSGSEVLHLLGQPTVKAVVIAVGIEDCDLHEIRGKATTIQLTESSTTKELIWELSHLAMPGNTTVQ